MPFTRAVFARNMETSLADVGSRPSHEILHDHSPINGEPLAEIAKSTAEDVEKALMQPRRQVRVGAHFTRARAEILLKIATSCKKPRYSRAGRTIDNGNPSASPATPTFLFPSTIPLLRCLCAGEEGALGELDQDTVAYHFKERSGSSGRSSLEFPPADGGMETGAGDWPGNSWSSSRPPTPRSACSSWRPGCRRSASGCL